MRRILPYAFLHFLNDAVSGLLIGSIVRSGHEGLEITLAILVYNILAFGGQWIFAEFLRPYLRSNGWILVSIALILLTPYLLPVGWKISILLAGISSAIVHVEGATVSYSISAKAKSLGLFAAPGIIGLALGGWASTWSFDITRILSILSIGLMLFFFRRKSSEEPKQHEEESIGEIDTHDIVMILLLSAIALRSAVWNLIQMAQYQNPQYLITLACVAAAGKIAGGYLSEKFGARNYNLIALMTSIPFFTLLRDSYLALLAGIFMMQSTFGTTALLMMRKFRNSPASGAAHAFGTPILIGGILYFTPARSWLNNVLGVFVLLSLSIVLLWFEKKKNDRRKEQKKAV